MLEETQGIKEASSSPNQNHKPAWTKSDPPPVLNEDQTEDFLLFYLHVHPMQDTFGRTAKVAKLLGTSLRSFYLEGSHFVASFTSKERRDHFHNLRLKEGNLSWKCETFPPLESEKPFFKAPPTIVSTRIRLIRVPQKFTLQGIEQSLFKSFPNLIMKSSFRETLTGLPTVLNGNISFFLEGIVKGTPWKYFRHEGNDLLLENPLFPLAKDATVPNTSNVLPFLFTETHPTPHPAPSFNFSQAAVVAKSKKRKCEISVVPGQETLISSGKPSPVENPPENHPSDKKKLPTVPHSPCVLFNPKTLQQKQPTKPKELKPSDLPRTNQPPSDLPRTKQTPLPASPPPAPILNQPELMDLEVKPHDLIGFGQMITEAVLPE